MFILSDVETQKRYEEIGEEEIFYKKFYLSESFIEKNSSTLKFSYISKYQTLNSFLIEKWSNRLHWGFISKYQLLNEEIMWKFRSKLTWKYIFKNKIINEDFIEKKKIRSEKLWSVICQNQPLSCDFIMRNIKNINKLSLEKNPFIDKKELLEKGFYFALKTIEKM